MGALLSLIWLQLSLREGFLLPPRDTLYLLVVFAEVQYNDPSCGEDRFTQVFGMSWPQEEDTTLPPTDADELLDPYPTHPPKGIITRTYYEASFGNLVILGDYLPRVISVPCKKLLPVVHAGAAAHAKIIAEALNALPDTVTAHGLPLRLFDRWDFPVYQTAGKPKRKAPTHDPTYRPALDAILIVWRNLRGLGDPNARLVCTGGYGQWYADVRSPVKNLTGGIQTASSFTSCGGAMEISNVLMAELMHAFYGGNHWHTAGGAGQHTFLAIPRSRGLTTQGGLPIAVCGYDRWALGWKAPEKTYLLSALDENFQEVPTDLVQPPQPLVQRFWLRDFFTTGDVIRIRLPYTEKAGPVKNQYLWLENHRFIASTDKYITFSSSDPHCPDNPYAHRFPHGIPGLYAYIQVGKDQLKGKDIYSSNPAHPNGLASWILPLTAEGNWDFFYDTTRIDPPNPSLPCNWGNTSVPIDKTRSLPNPFTGFSDLFLTWDTNGDGKLHSGDLPIHLTEIRGDTLLRTGFSFGDWEDGFSSYTHKEISLSTNPAPVPVYTYISSEGLKAPISTPPAPYENRTIWLSGLCIRILQEKPDGTMLVEIRWDDFTVRENVRWCGNIVVSPNPFTGGISLQVAKNKILLLDRGYSPTYYVTRNGYFTDPTLLRIEKGAHLHLSKRSRIVLRGGSQLVLEPGAKITWEKGAKIIIEQGEIQALEGVSLPPILKR